MSGLHGGTTTSLRSALSTDSWNLIRLDLLLEPFLHLVLMSPQWVQRRLAPDNQYVDLLQPLANTRLTLSFFRDIRRGDCVFQLLLWRRVFQHLPSTPLSTRRCNQLPEALRPSLRPEYLQQVWEGLS